MKAQNQSLKSTIWKEKLIREFLSDLAQRMQDYVKTNLQRVHTMPKLLQNMAMLKVYEPIQTHIVLNDEQVSFAN